MDAGHTLPVGPQPVEPQAAKWTPVAPLTRSTLHSCTLNTWTLKVGNPLILTRMGIANITYQGSDTGKNHNVIYIEQNEGVVIIFLNYVCGSIIA